MSLPTSRCVVLVTGGAGFLGQHVVGMLQARADHVTEIRVLDLTPYQNRLDYEAKKPVKSYIGSVTDADLVHRACQGVDCVMHVASIVDTTLIPDTQLSYQINVEGTRNVITACVQQGVKRLIYCSTVEVVTGQNDIIDGTEDTTQITSDHIFTAYGPSKIEAERLVLQANSDKLRTVALRPAVMYGELDWRSYGRVVTCYTAKKLKFYVQVGCGSGLADHVYVGNVAWGFVCAETALFEDKVNDKVTGSSYFIVDDSPRKSIFDFMEPIMREVGLKPLKPAIPLWVCLWPLYILYIIFSLVCTVHRVNFAIGTAPFLTLARRFVFKYDKASRLLGYHPLYSYDEAKSRTVKFFKAVAAN